MIALVRQARITNRCVEIIIEVKGVKSE